MSLEKIPIGNPSDVARAVVALVPAPHSDLKALEAAVYEMCFLASRDVAVWIADGKPIFGNKSGGAIKGTMVQVVVSSGA